MNIWKYLIAASLGNMIAGPLGALAFTAGAFFLGKKNSFRNPGSQFNKQQGIYAIGLVVLSAKLAKADGRVTKDEIADVQNLRMYLDVNGQRMQDGSTNTMIFSARYIVYYLSQFMSLNPGDIIATGTPPGVGGGMKPPVFLKAGDKMKLGIEGLGEQNQVCIQG